MKFDISKSRLCEAFDRLFSVATKSPKVDWQLGNRVTLVVNSKNLSVLAWNGHLQAKYVIGEVDNSEDGTVTVDVSVGRGIVHALGSPESTIEVEVKNDSLVLTDLSAKSKSRNRVVKMQTLSDNLDFTISEPQRPEYKYVFNREQFCYSCKLVGKYKAVLRNKIKYLMICLHFFKDSIRYVCGDGMRFAVMSYGEDPSPGEEGKKYILPVDQVDNIISVVERSESDEIAIYWKNGQECYIKSGSAEMVLMGIPREDYINYEVHAFRQAEAKAIVDVVRGDLAPLIAISGATKDKQREQEGAFHACRLQAEENVLKIVVNEGRYQCDLDVECAYRKIHADTTSFKAAYSWEFLDDVVKAVGKEMIRFYCISETGIMITEPCNVNENEKDENHVSMKKKDDNRLIFFFAAAVEEA